MGKAKVTLSAISAFAKNVDTVKTTADAFIPALNDIEKCIAEINKEIQKVDKEIAGVSKALISINNKIAKFREEIKKLQSELKRLESRLAATDPTREVTYTYQSGTDEDGNPTYSSYTTTEPNPVYLALQSEISSVKSQLTNLQNKLLTAESIKSQLDAVKAKLSNAKDVLQRSKGDLTKSKNNLQEKATYISKCSDSAKQTLSKAIKAVQKYLAETVKILPVGTRKSSFGGSIGSSAESIAGGSILANSQELYTSLSNGKIPDKVFSPNEIKGGADVLENYTKQEYEKLLRKNPKKASQLLTDYCARKIPRDDLSKQSRDLIFSDYTSGYAFETILSENSAKIRTDEGKVLVVYPNPMLRMPHMMGRQGQNDIGMHQDCGIASTAKSINDAYGRIVTTENRLATYARETRQCSMYEEDVRDWGGTNELNVAEFYKANGLSPKAYQRNKVPTLESLGEVFKKGGTATVAVSSDILWHYHDAKDFDENMVDTYRYEIDPRYAAAVDAYSKMKCGEGEFVADHFVNVSNAVYDEKGNLTHFIVSDTGNGTTKMIHKIDFQRAYNGYGKISIKAQGCVTATLEEARK